MNEENVKNKAAAKTSLTGEIRAILHLALPLALSQLVWIGISTSDIWMMGRIGTLELASGSLAMRAYQPFYFWTLGMLSVTTALMAQGLGAGDASRVRRAFRSGVLLASFFGVLFALPVWAGPWLLPYLGQDPALAAYAGDFFIWTAIGLPIIFVFQMLRFFSVSMGTPSMQLLASVIGLVANLVLNELLALGLGPLPEMGLGGIAAATTLSYAITVLVMMSIVRRHEELKKWDIFRNWWRLDRPSVKGILRLGTPTGFIVLSETSMFAIVSLMLGVFGAAALAASAISFQVTSIAFMLPLAVGQAALVRTGRAAGAGDMSALRQTGRAAMTLAAGSGLVNMLVILIFREQLAELFLASSDGLVQQVVVLAIPMLIITALFQIPEALQAVTLSLLRGINDTFWPALISMAGYWVAGVGLAWVFGFSLGLGPTSVWGAIGLALVLNGIVMVSRWFWQLRRIATDGSILRN